jgi:peroxiredoxin
MPPKLQPIYINIFQNDISQKNANGTWRLPVPGTFVIDREGIIRARHVTADFTRRMEPEDVLQALRGL